MKVALIAGYKDGAIDQVMRPLAKELTALGFQADLITYYDMVDKDQWADTLNSYDLVHWGFFMYALPFQGLITTKQTGNVWHIGVGQTEKYQEILHNLDLDRIVVDDGDCMTLQQLGQLGLTKVTPIPILFDYGRFQPLPEPEGPFTVGIFCNDYNYKRYDIILKACEQAGVECHAMILPENRKMYSLDPIKDVYAHIHVLAHATFVDTNSLPAREALLCGRPVIATRSGGLERVLDHGRNGLFFDGSVKDLVRKIAEAMENYPALASGAEQTYLPAPSGIAYQYKEMFESVVHED